MISLFMDLIDDIDQKQQFNDIYYKYRQKLFFIAKSFLHDDGHAEDALQECFLRVAKNIGKVIVLDSSQLLNFLICIIKSVCIDYLRKQKRRVREVEIYGDDCEGEEIFDSIKSIEDSMSYFMDDSIIESIDKKEIIKRFQSISEKDQMAVEMYIVYGYELEDIAALLGTSKNAACKRIARGLAKMKEELTNDKKSYKV